MLYFLLHQNKYNIKEDNLKIIIKSIHDKDNIYLSQSLLKYLNITKHNISKYGNEWDIYKKYTNPYEFIHTNIPYLNFSISKYKPISRAFFKLVEIYNVFDIQNKFTKNIQTFHLAEGPGGFIEATAKIRNNPNDIYYGMTLLNKKDNSIPGWKKSEKFLNNHKNVKLEYGISQDGDLYNELNFQYCVKKYKNSMNIITGDGGFDFSIDFNSQERSAVKIIFIQTAYAIALQKYGGCFILKIYDMFLKSTIDIIMLLSIFYKNVYITKPKTSRYANSEKYIVCCDFKYTNSGFILKKIFNIIKLLNNIDFTQNKIHSILNIPINLYLKHQLEEINAIFGQQQIENISNTIKLIYNNDKKKDKLENIKSQNVQKCINWCIQNDIEYNKNSQYSNIFLN
tara:strand:+ start:2796 stop:3986 length:1191 start_codon:yes stop_codon:yes gene_type:complete